MEQNPYNLSPNQYASIRSKKPPLYKNMQIVLPVLALVLMVASFYGGIAYQKNKGVDTASAMQGGPGRFSQVNRAIGTVSSVSDTSITVTTRSNTSVTYTLTSTTTVTNNGSAASIGDITTGDMVMLELASSASKTVTSITLNPTFNGPMGAGSSSSNATSTGDTESI